MQTRLIGQPSFVCRIFSISVKNGTMEQLCMYLKCFFHEQKLKTRANYVFFSAEKVRFLQPVNFTGLFAVFDKNQCYIKTLLPQSHNTSSAAPPSFSGFRRFYNSKICCNFPTIRVSFKKLSLSNWGLKLLCFMTSARAHILCTRTVHHNCDALYFARYELSTITRMLFIRYESQFFSRCHFLNRHRISR